MLIFNENNTNLAIEIMDGNFQAIDTFNLVNDKSLLIQMKVSGDIFAFPETEMAIYSENNLPLNALNEPMITRFYKDMFLMTDDPILKVVYEVGSESGFSDVSYCGEGSISDDVFLDFQVTLEFWNQHHTELKEDKLLYSLSGTNGIGD